MLGFLPNITFSDEHLGQFIVYLSIIIIIIYFFCTYYFIIYFYNLMILSYQVLIDFLLLNACLRYLKRISNESCGEAKLKGTIYTFRRANGNSLISTPLTNVNHWLSFLQPESFSFRKLRHLYPNLPESKQSGEVLRTYSRGLMKFRFRWCLNQFQ